MLSSLDSQKPTVSQGNIPVANSVTIVDTTIPVLEYQGQRVVTLAMVDMLHHRPDGTAKRHFRENKERFVEGKHFFHLSFQDVKSLDEFRTAGIVPNSQGIVVLTERGYSMLVKSFTDDFAWEVQEQLVDSYFDTHKPMSTAEFLVEQANLILEHENKIKALQSRQAETDVRIAETRQEVKVIGQRAEDAFEAASAALRHKFGESDHYTILAFCGKNGIKIDLNEAKIRGMHASKLSATLGKDVIKIPDERYGKVGSYHLSVLNAVFKDKLSKEEV